MDQISQNPVSGSPEPAAFKLDSPGDAAPDLASQTSPPAPVESGEKSKKIKLWAFVFGGIVVVVIALVVIFGKTAFYKGQTPPPEDAKIDSEETRSAAAEEPKGKTEEIAQETPISVSDSGTKPVEIALLIPEKEAPAAEETATAAKTAEEQAVQESAAAQALTSQVGDLMRLINQLLEQIGQAIANGNLAEAERLTAQLLQTVQKMQNLAAQAQTQAAEASASAAVASTASATLAATQAQTAATQAQAVTAQAQAAAQEAEAIMAEASNKITGGTETATPETAPVKTEASTDKTAEGETVAADDFIAQCIASGGYITDNKQCNVKTVGVYDSLATLQAGLADYGNCVSDPKQQWLDDTQECTKTEYGSGDKEKEESIKDGSSKDGGLKIADQTSTPDDLNAELIQSLRDEIERLRLELRTNQNNSAILARIAELEAALVRLGQQAPVNVTVTVPAGGAGQARTECADPSFTYDPVREVCVPPTEVIVRPAASGSGRISRRPGEGGATDEAPASPDEARSDSVSVGAAPPTTQDGAPAATSIAGTTGDRTGIGAAGTTTTGAYGTFIQGGTGPAILLYPVLVGIANGLWYLARRRKNK